VLGLAWIGTTRVGGSGICANTANYAGQFLNTGISTSINFGSPTSMQVRTISLAHEWGHNFGSDHDTPATFAPADTGADSKESCTPGTVGEENGNYLMYYKATDGDEINNLYFSPCSRYAISEVIDARAADCFESIEYEICGTFFQVAEGTGSAANFCGDGEIDDTELCDCGSDDEDECFRNDPCCTVDCQIRGAGNECSHQKSTSCCTSECKFVGLDFATTMDLYSKASLESKDAFEEEYTNAYRAKYPEDLDAEGSVLNSVPFCTVDQDCFRSQVCIADPLFKGACPKTDFVYEPAADVAGQDVCFDYQCTINLDTDVESMCALSKDDVPPCLDDMTTACYPFQYPRTTKCNNNKNFCNSDGCAASLCSAWPMTDQEKETPTDTWWSEAANQNKRAESCRLKYAIGVSGNADYELINVGSECHTGCRWQEDGECISTDEYAKSRHAAWISNAGYEEVKLITRDPGMSCFYNDDLFAGRCRDSVDADNKKEVVCGSAGSSVTMSLDPQAVKRWIKENWPVAVGLVVGGVLLFFALKYTYKKKKPALRTAMINLKNKTLRHKKEPSEGHTATEHAKVPVTSKRHQMLKKQLKASQAIKRLECFFPGAKRDNVDFKSIVKKVENERQAVKKLLNLGYEFRVPEQVPLLDDGHR
jgi:hypothetical protein